MKRYRGLALAALVSMVGVADLGHTAALNVVYTGDVRGTLGVCG